MAKSLRVATVIVLLFFINYIHYIFFLSASVYEADGWQVGFEVLITYRDLNYPIVY